MAASSTDLRLAFSAKIGSSILFHSDTTAQQISDEIGALPPGKYFIHTLSLTGRCWIKTTPFEKGVAADITVPVVPAVKLSSLVPTFPLDAAGVKSFEIHVRQGINDRLQAICEAAGDAVLVITKTGE